MFRHPIAAVLLVFGSAAVFAQPGPPIFSVSPLMCLTTAPSCPLTINGAGFMPGSTVWWSGTPLPTTFVSVYQLTASVPGNLFQSVVGSRDFDVWVVIPGGARSNTVKVQVIEPVRATDLKPNPVIAGGPQFTLTVNGSGFESGMIVRWQGLNLITTFVSRNVLQAMVPAALIANPGAIEITVFHPGHGWLPPLSLAVQPATPPIIASLNPISAIAGSAEFTLTVTGSGFLGGAAVRWNATHLASALLGAGQLSAVVPSHLTANPGNATITVANPNGIISNAITFSVSCDYQVGAAGPVPPGATTAVIPAGGGTGAVRVTTATACFWTAISTEPWLTISGPAYGSGAATIGFSVAANPGPARSTVLTIAGRGYAVSQLAAQRVPVVAQQNGVVNAASLDPAIASGTWVSVFGVNLSATSRTWTGSDFTGDRLPTRLDGVGVSINRKPAYVYYISPTQLNVLAPEDPAEGPVPVEVTTPDGKSDAVLVRKQRIAPALFTFSGRAARYVAAVFPDGVLVLTSGLIDGASARPAKPGDRVALYATGLGQTNPAFEDGQVVRLPAPVTDEVSVQLGEVSARVEFAGIVGSGLYQVNIQVPEVPDGDVAVVVRSGGVESPAKVFLPVRR